MKKLLTGALVLLTSAGCMSTDNIRQYEPFKMEGMFVGDATITHDLGDQVITQNIVNVYVPVSQIDASMQYWGVTALPVSSQALVKYQSYNPSFFFNLWTDTTYDGEFDLEGGEVRVETEFIFIDPDTGDRSVTNGPIATYELFNLKSFDVMSDDLLITNDAFSGETHLPATLPQIVAEFNMRPDILEQSLGAEVVANLR